MKSRLWFLACLMAAAGGCQLRSPEFYPIGIYAVPSTNDFSVVREAGFNVVAGPAAQDYLNAAQREGLRVLASPGTSAGPGFDPAQARQAITALDSHPALWAWYLVDEPDLHNVPPQDVRNVHLFFKRLKARKPTALVIYYGGAALDYANITDLTMVDRYPIPWLPLADFPKHVRMARLALGKKKPLIAVIQAFDWNAYPENLAGEKNLRPPTYEELRCMTYCALAHRATGLFFYAFNSGSWDIQKHPEVWDALKRVVAEVHELLPLFQAEHIWWPYVHRFGEQEGRFNAALDSSVTPALLRVRKGNDFLPPGDYILAVNNTDQLLNYQISLPEPFGGALRVVGENRYTLIEDNFLEDEFEPYAVRIYGPLPDWNTLKRLPGFEKFADPALDGKQAHGER